MEGFSLKANLDLRQAAIEAHVRLWQVATALGITDATFSRRLRRELPQEEKQKILKIIEHLKGGSTIEK